MGDILNSEKRTPVVIVLTPVYNEEESLPVYEKTVSEVLLSSTDFHFKILLIDDGSTDRSWELIKDICARRPDFSGIRLSRNYGSHIALSAGFANAEGDAFATLACDLQDPPEVILRFLGEWKSGAQIVWGSRNSRKDELWRVIASNLFYRIIKRFAMPKGSRFTTGSFFLIDRQVAACFRQFQENNRITFALVAWTGFEQRVVEYDRRKRLKGKSGWTFFKMLRSMYDTFIGFSLLPVRIMTLLGVSSFIATIPLSAYVLLSKINGHPVPGWAGLMFTLSFFFGIQFLLMGITGEYLYRIYSEVVKRPIYFLSDKANMTRLDGNDR